MYIFKRLVDRGCNIRRRSLGTLHMDIFKRLVDRGCNISRLSLGRDPSHVHI